MTKAENNFAVQRRNTIKMLGIGSASGLIGLLGTNETHATTYEATKIYLFQIDK